MAVWLDLNRLLGLGLDKEWLRSFVFDDSIVGNDYHLKQFLHLAVHDVRGVLDHPFSDGAYIYHVLPSLNSYP